MVCTAGDEWEAEQQALTKWGLNYVLDEYLPRKLRKPDAFLP